MPRFPRQKYDEAIYHIAVRGNNREEIFFCDDDKVRYLDTLKRYKERFQICIYAYCLMDNHVHLIIDSNGQDISRIMKGISLSYAIYFNKKYGRCGHLFQDRFWSQIIEDDLYVMGVSRYVHQNPVRAGMTKTAIEYKWSSIDIYRGKKDCFEIIEEEFILKNISNDKGIARQKYIEFVEEKSENDKLEVEKNNYLNCDRKVRVVGESISKVLRKVAMCFNVCTEDIVTKYSKRFAQIKQVAVYLICLKSKLPHKEIGQKFGVSGSCIGHKVKKAIELIRNDIEMNKYFQLILQS